MSPARARRSAAPTDLPDLPDLETSDLETSEPPTPSGPLSFRQPASLTSEETPETWLPDASPSDGDAPSALNDDPSAASPRSSRASSADNPLSRQALRDAAREGVKIAGTVAHELLARDDAARHAGLYLADDDDAQAIGDPLANLAYRRGGIGAVANPDLADAIAALVGLALYAVKQLNRRRIAKALRNGPAVAGAEPLSEGGEGQWPGTGVEAVSGPENG